MRISGEKKKILKIRLFFLKEGSTDQSISVLSGDPCNSDDLDTGLCYVKAMPGGGRTWEGDNAKEVSKCDTEGQLNSKAKKYSKPWLV